MEKKKAAYEARITQVERERDQLTQELESLNKKLQMQQRQLENIQKHAAGVRTKLFSWYFVAFIQYVCKI